MTTLRNFIDDLADELGDFVAGNPQLSFQQWSERLLLTFINEGLDVIATYKPGDFIQPVIYKLSPGYTQAPACKVLGSITEQVDAMGNHIATIRNSTSNVALRWSKTICAPSDYRIGMVYSVSKNGHFDVSPPVPFGVDAYVKLFCVKPPAELTIGNMDDVMTDYRYLAPLRQWVLFRALADSRDSTSELNEAWKHERSFYTLLGVQYKMEQTVKPNSGTTNPPGAPSGNSTP